MSRPSRQCLSITQAYEMTAILGPPGKQILLGANTIFVNADVKVVFVDGKVTDAEYIIALKALKALSTGLNKT
jgi:hypothetical protein